MKNKLLKIVNNSPVVLGFAGICVVAYIVDLITGGFSNGLLFSVYRSSLKDIFTYFRFFGHVFGHANIDHLMNNMMLILVTGPMLEEKYGGKFLIKVMAVTAFVTGLVHFLIFPNVALLGASGIVYAFIVLSSITGYKNKEIPLTLIIVAFLYIGTQVYDGLFTKDNISQLTHIIGGIIGGIMGYFEYKKGNV